MGEIKIDLNACVGDRICAEKCPIGVLEIVTVERKKQARVANPDQCIECHTCELECPYSAITVLPLLGEEFADMK